MPHRNLKLLIVDDDEDDYVMIRDLIGELVDVRYALTWAPSYEEGVRLLHCGGFDLCLVDYRLGARTGLEFLREAIEQGYQAPIIVLTGYGDSAVDIEAMRQGAADYLVKTQITAPLLERSIRYSVHNARSMRELRLREQSFRDLFNSTFEGVFIHRQGEIIDANEVAARVFGYSRREMLGRSYLEFISPQDIAVAREKIVADGEVHYQVTGIRKDGSEMCLEVMAKPYQFQGERVRLTAVRDVTARKQMEAHLLLQDRLASIGLLASSLAHEIGTPLGVIRGRAEFLTFQVRDNEVVRSNAEIIATQIDRVSKLIRSLLTLARGERLSEITAAVSLHEVAGEVLELMAHETRKHAIEVNVRLDPGIRARAESGPLHQVLLNLLVNAVHAIEAAIAQGRPAPHAIEVFAEDAGGQWALCVQDSGTGISAENIKNLFKPFFTTKDIGQGTGLGLATSYRIVEAWGGSIAVSTQVGIGTTFKVLLPKAV